MPECYVLTPVHDNDGRRVEPGQKIDLFPKQFLRLSRAGAVEAMEVRAARLEGDMRAVAAKKAAEEVAAKEAAEIEAEAAAKVAELEAAAEAEAKREAEADKAKARRGRKSGR